MNNEAALVVLSGGQDSCTCLYWAKSMFEEVHAITFDYGQKHDLEIECAQKIALMAKIKSYEIINVENTLKSTSPLLEGEDLERYDDYNHMCKVIGNRIEKTFVPMRNTLFLTIAANRAMYLNCRSIVIGICQEDNANYPDCTGNFAGLFEETLNMSLGKFRAEEEIKIVAPLLYYSKKETVELAAQLSGCFEALAYSHTSYDGKYPPTDKNHSNLLREQGFIQAGYPDPLIVRAWREGVMELPPTKNYDSIREQKRRMERDAHLDTRIAQ